MDNPTLTPPMTGPEITRLRESKKWTREQMAAYLSVNARTVKRWEQGLTYPSPLALLGLRGMRVAGGEVEKR